MKKEGYVRPIIVLLIICVAVSGLLAYVNSITSPIIAEAALENAINARLEIMPDGGTFTDVSDTPNLPEGVDEAYVSDEGQGYIFIVNGSGYGGNLQIIIGIDEEGKIAGTKVLEHHETAGLGDRIAKPAGEGNNTFQDQFGGKDFNLVDVKVISGSTISSNSFIKLVNKAFEAVEILKQEGM